MPNHVLSVAGRVQKGLPAAIQNKNMFLFCGKKWVLKNDEEYDISGKKQLRVQCFFKLQELGDTHVGHLTLSGGNSLFVW